MKKLFPLLLIFTALTFQSCRETVPPETLEDSETSRADSVEVDLEDYDDEP